MIPDAVHKLLQNPSEDAREDALLDKAVFFWVDWREDDDQIAGMCETVLKTGDLKSEWDEGEQLMIVRGQQRLPVALIKSALTEWVLWFTWWLLPSFVTDHLQWPLRGNRHTTLVAVNRALQPDYEIRLVNGSCDGDEAAFLPLSKADWAALEEKYGPAPVAAAFTPIGEPPNFFTDPASPAQFKV